MFKRRTRVTVSPPETWVPNLEAGEEAQRSPSRAPHAGLAPPPPTQAWPPRPPTQAWPPPTPHSGLVPPPPAQACFREGLGLRQGGGPHWSVLKSRGPWAGGLPRAVAW